MCNFFLSHFYSNLIDGQEANQSPRAAAILANTNRAFRLTVAKRAAKNAGRNNIGATLQNIKSLASVGT